MRVVALWSGGKDSCLACFKAKQAEHEIKAIINFTSTEHGQSISHGVSAALLRDQASLTGIPFLQNQMPKVGYREEFIKLMRAFKSDEGIEGIVFGDIYLTEHKEWIDDVCGEMGLVPVMPLWGVSVEEIYDEFIGLGFETIIVSAKAEFLGEEYIGQKLNENMKSVFIEKGIDLCGEKGEFHTFVVSGPLFNKKIKIDENRVYDENGNWRYNIMSWNII
jgi:uncharacterized protein (TIGR00290 family)